MAQINIGLLTNDGWLKVSEVEQALEVYGVTVLESRVVIADSVMEEDTFVARVSGFSYDKIFKIAQTLRQDCIAVQFEGGKGVLIGPKAEAWGIFDASRFLTLEVVAG